MQGFRPFQRYSEFSGRSGRAEFWQFFALTTAISMAAQLLLAGSGVSEATTRIVAVGLNGAYILPAIAVGVRRFHDIDRSGKTYVAVWILWIALIMGTAAAAGMAMNQMIEPERQNVFGIVALGVGAVALLVTIWFVVQLAKAGNPYANEYGAPDNVPAQVERPAVRGVAVLPPAALRAQAPPHSMDDALEAVERLGAMREKGLITDEEFAEQKRRVLG